MKRTGKLTLLITLGLLISSANYLFSQNCEAYFPTEEGTELVYENYNKRDKLESVMKQKLLSVVESGDTTIFKIHQQIFDQKDELLYEGELQFKCYGNKFYLDMQSFINPEQFKAYENMEMEMSMDDISLPDELAVGMELDEGFINMKIDAQMMSMNFNTRIFDRKVEAIEELSTPAGTFETYKISSSTESKTPMMTITTSSTTWYSEEYGMIRSENYDKKGKLESYSLLVKIER
ncbi:MAG: hypothetical protein U5Q03_14155 [Bacteroidota bacterium]|nr:hypothetical protein [Bacteroidota bacterium]